jgi:hypothetical protein
MLDGEWGPPIDARLRELIAFLRADDEVGLEARR